MVEKVVIALQKQIALRRAVQNTVSSAVDSGDLEKRAKREIEIRYITICIPGFENLTTSLVSNFGLFANFAWQKHYRPKAKITQPLFIYLFIHTVKDFPKSVLSGGLLTTIRSLKHVTPIN